MRGFRKPTKTEVINNQRDVIKSLLSIVEKQDELISDMTNKIKGFIKDVNERQN